MLRVLVNLLIFVGELAAIAAVAAFAFYEPLLFSLATAALVMITGAYLEYARLAHELPFYLGQSSSAAMSGLRRALVWLMSLSTTIAKSVVSGLVALMTFSGTDPDRQLAIVIIFGVCLFLGTSLLRRLSISFKIHPARWGYFRLAIPLGLAFAAGLALASRFGFLKAPTAGELTRKIFLETPELPSIAQASELLFQLKQFIDTILLTLLKTVLPPDAADIVSIAVSANVLVGMVLAVFAVVIATAVYRAEVR